MTHYRAFLLSWTSVWMVLCLSCILYRTSTACPVGIGGQSSFTAAPGGSQSQTWTISDDIPGDRITVTITSGADVFIVDQSPIVVPSNGTVTFAITFKPGISASGTFKGTFTTNVCPKTFQLVGTVSASGVADSLPSNVSITITPNPGTDNFNILSSGVRSAEIGIFDLLGKKLASSKASSWKWNSSGIEAGSYIVRVSGESIGGDPFVISRQIIIER